MSPDMKEKCENSQVHSFILDNLNSSFILAMMSCLPHFDALFMNCCSKQKFFPLLLVPDLRKFTVVEICSAGALDFYCGKRQAGPIGEN